MRTTTPTPSPARHQLWRPTLALAIDYLRWTQLVPMVMAWAFLLLMVAALLVTNFQQQSFSLFQWGVTTYERVLGPTERESQPASPPVSAAPEQSQGNEGVHFSEADVRPWVLKIWAALALAGWLLGLLRSWLFGPRRPMSLRRKLGWTAIAGAVCSALCFAAWLFGSETSNGSAVGWVALFVGAPALVWCVSAWALSVGHLLDLVRGRLEHVPTGAPRANADERPTAP